MESLEIYADFANRLSLSEFREKVPFMVLLKRPREKAPVAGPITFHTETVAHGDHELITDTGPFSEQYWVWRLKKKSSSNPLTDRVSIGRATNCDLVFRLSFVSKLHAAFLIDGLRIRLVDQGSSNGTEVNGQRLVPQVEKDVKPGDKIKFGAIELELMEPGQFYDFLRNEYRR